MRPTQSGLSLLGWTVMIDALKLLISERDRLNQAIAVLQEEAPRAGRASGGDKKAAKKSRRKRTFSAEARKKQSEKMRAYWAARRKAAKKTSK